MYLTNKRKWLTRDLLSKPTLFSFSIKAISIKRRRKRHQSRPELNNGYRFHLTYFPTSTQASELLRDMALGANMRVHLVRMIILSEPEVTGWPL